MSVKSEITCIRSGDRSAASCSVLTIGDQVYDVLDADQRQPHDIAHVMIALRFPMKDPQSKHLAVKLTPQNALRLASRLMDSGLDLMQSTPDPAPAPALSAPSKLPEPPQAENRVRHIASPKPTANVEPPERVGRPGTQSAPSDQPDKPVTRRAVYTAKLLSERWRRFPQPPPYKEIARKLAVSTGLICHWRTGLALPANQEHIRRLADLLQIPRAVLQSTIEKDRSERRTN